MKFLFLTDFHGNHSAYKKAFRKAEELGCAAVVNGGDGLPKDFPTGTPFAKSQKEFWDSWLVPKIEKLRQRGIAYYHMFGNDDSRGILNQTLNKTSNQGTLTRLDARGWIKFGDYEILGFPHVPDYPFRLKDWCCGDLERVPVDNQFGSPLYTDQFHFIPVPKPWHEEIALRPSMLDRLNSLPLPQDPARAIFVMHSPPALGGLDVCADGRRVGTKAGLAHMQDRQYLLGLHGHIHEAPKVSGQWYSRLGDTLCVQPGATPPTWTFVDLENRVVRNPIHGEVSF